MNETNINLNDRGPAEVKWDGYVLLASADGDWGYVADGKWTKDAEAATQFEFAKAHESAKALREAGWGVCVL